MYKMIKGLLRRKKKKKGCFSIVLCMFLVFKKSRQVISGRNKTWRRGRTIVTTPPYVKIAVLYLRAYRICGL